MESQSQALPTEQKFTLTYKKLFFFWLPIILSVLIIILTVYIFVGKGARYTALTQFLSEGSFYNKAINMFDYTFIAMPRFAVDMLLVFLSLVFLFTELYLVRRASKIKKYEQSSAAKLVGRNITALILSILIAVVSIVIIPAVSFAVSFAYGFVDVKLNNGEIVEKAITLDQDIIDAIKNSDEIIEVYDASHSAAVVLAARDLRRKEEISTYEGIVLPILVNILSDNSGKNYYIPETRSIVYTHFEKNTTDKIIIELAFNRIKNSENELLAKAYQENPAPSVLYLNDDEFAPYVKQKSRELDQNDIDSFKEIISENERVIAECKALVIANTKLVAEQEGDYQNNCIKSVNYSDCKEFRQKIDENIEISNNTAARCREDMSYLNTQYQELKDFEQEIYGAQNDELGGQKGELSAGMYFLSTKAIYMRVMPGNDAFSYLETLLHELLHHYSDAGSELPTLVNEGITDVLTYKAFGYDEYEIADTAGYFKEVQVVMALTEKIPEDELVNVYFRNKPEEFETLFKKYFPDIEYAEFLSRANKIFRESFGVTEEITEMGYWDTNVDHPDVQEMREFLGLPRLKFYAF